MVLLQYLHVSHLGTYLYWSLENFHEVWNQKVTWNDKLYACLDYNWNMHLKQGNMWTSVYATYKCNMCNTYWTHVEQPSETCVACILKQTHETWWWNNYSISLEFYVSMHVRSTLLCNLCMVCMFGLYNTLTTLRTLNGTIFMLIILPKCASKGWLTMYGP
jgi:hypothetical protein